jgi:hypothetical protein
MQHMHVLRGCRTAGARGATSPISRCTTPFRMLLFMFTSAFHNSTFASQQWQCKALFAPAAATVRRM